MLTRDDFKRPRKRKQKVVHLPELGGDVIVQAMSAGERAVYEAEKLDENGRIIPAKFMTARERLIVRSVVDEAGDPLFTSKDIDWLKTLPADEADLLYETAAELSGIWKPKDKAGGDLAGNSATPPVSDGSSDTLPSQQADSTGGVTSTN